MERLTKCKGEGMVTEQGVGADERDGLSPGEEVRGEIGVSFLSVLC